MVRMTRCIPKPLRICAYTQPSLILLFHLFCIVTHTHTSLWERKKTKQPYFGCTLICDAILMLKLCHHVTSQPIQDFLEVFFVFFQYRMRYFCGEQEKESIIRVRWDRQIHPSRSPFVITGQAS